MVKKRKLGPRKSNEVRLRAVQEVLRNPANRVHIAHNFGIPYSTLYAWCRLYNRDKTAFDDFRKVNVYSEELKNKVVQEIINRKSGTVQEIVSKYKISYNTVSTWLRQYRNGTTIDKNNTIIESTDKKNTSDIPVAEFFRSIRLWVLFSVIVQFLCISWQLYIYLIF
jgi:transposase-like protein